MALGVFFDSCPSILCIESVSPLNSEAVDRASPWQLVPGLLSLDLPSIGIAGELLCPPRSFVDAREPNLCPHDYTARALDMQSLQHLYPDFDLY